MRWLIALAGALVFAGAAHAQGVVCLQAQSEWNRASSSGDVSLMIRVEGRLAGCPSVQQQARAKIAALQAQYAQLEQKRLAAQRLQQQQRQQAAADDQTARDDADRQAELAALTPTAPTGPVEPCSVTGVQQRFPKVPVLMRPNVTSLSQRTRADLAGQYVERGDAFHQCHDDAQALGDYKDAQALDPRNFGAFVAQGDLLLDGKDYPAAIDAYGRAISVKDAASPDDNVLSAYAGRAEAEAALQRYPDEIADLQFVTENYPNYNTAQQSDLGPPSHYHELLGKALYLTHDDAGAIGELGFVDKKDLDWQDLRFLAGRSLQARQWTTAIDQLKQALADMAGDDTLKPRKAEIEVMMAAAYLASGDQTDALDHYKIAEAYDPSNADARAGHQSIGDPPPPPSFTDPDLQTVTLPDGVGDLGRDTPPPFCGQVAKNAYLDTVNAATEAVNANVTTIGLVSADLLKRRAVYDADTRLSYEEKIRDLALFDAQLKKLHDESTTLYATGQALLAFFHRINDDRSNVTTCRQGASAAGG